MKKIQLLQIGTDGSCRKKVNTDGDGKSGLGFVKKIIYEEDGKLGVYPIPDDKRTFSIGFRLSTPQRMELAAIIYALQSIPSENQITYPIEIITDSQYAAMMLAGYDYRTMAKEVENMPAYGLLRRNVGPIHKWKSNGWRTSSNTNVLNTDLIIDLISLCERYDLYITKILGHKGNSLNEEADALASNAALYPTMIDVVYEKLKEEKQKFVKPIVMPSLSL